jgi:hypothetical protein
MDTPEQQIKNDRDRKARAAMKAVAAERTTITYSDLLSEINWNVLPKSPQLTELLCKISATCLKSDETLLSAVVVNADSEQNGIPGSGFFEFAADKGFEFSNERTFWDVEVEKVYKANSNA